MLPPAALRPFVGFAKQTPQSLKAIARVVERDDEFRSRVADAVDEDQVGRAGWLWLTRPDGWEDELAALESAAAARTADEQEARAERSATRRLAASQAAAQRAEAEAAARQAEIDALRAELAAERAQRVTGAARVAELENEVAGLTAERAEVVRNLKSVEARLVDRSTEVNALRARTRALEAQVRERDSGGIGHPTSRDRGGATRSGPPESDTGPRAPSTTTPASTPAAGAATPAPPPAAAGPDRAAIAGEIARAASGAAAVADGLAALARLLGASDPAPTGDLGAAPGQALEEGSGTGADGPGAALRRVPISLPGGMFDDSVEAADHLLRTPGVVLIVDGYNVTMTGWPEAGAGEQRRRLVTALHDLSARTSTPSEVVFDGAEVDAWSVPAPGRRLVRVRFSPPGVEADDVVIDLVERLPALTPLVVASSDKRVREGARRLGANLIHARQLLELLGRR